MKSVIFYYNVEVSEFVLVTIILLKHWLLPKRFTWSLIYGIEIEQTHLGSMNESSC